MKDFMLHLIGISVLLGVLFMIAPSKHKKHLRLLGGLCLLSVFTSLLPSLTGDGNGWLSSLFDEMEEDSKSVYEEIYHQTLSDANVDRLESELESLMVRDLSLPSDGFSVSVSWEWSEDRILLKKATVYLSGSGVLCDPHAIADYTEALLDCPCEIVYGVAEKS